MWLGSKEVAAVTVSPSSGPYGCRSPAKSLTRTVNCHSNSAAREVSKTKSSGVTFISSWNRWFTICSLSFGGRFSGVTKVRTGFLSPVLVWGTYLTSHHCKNPNMLWLTLVLFVIRESCRIKDSNYFFLRLVYLYLQFCFYCNASHDEVAGLWSFHLYFMVGGKNRGGQRGHLQQEILCGREYSC